MKKYLISLLLITIFLTNFPISLVFAQEAQTSPEAQQEAQKASEPLQEIREDEWMERVIKTSPEAIKALPDIIRESLREALDFYKKTYGKVFNLIKPWGEKIINKIKNILKSIKFFLMREIEKRKPVIKEEFEKEKQEMEEDIKEKIKEAIKERIKKLLPKIDKTIWEKSWEKFKELIK